MAQVAEDPFVSFEEIVEAYPGRDLADESWGAAVPADMDAWEQEQIDREQARRQHFAELLRNFENRERGRVESSYYGRKTRNGAVLLGSEVWRKRTLSPASWFGPRREVWYKLYTKLDLVGAEEAATLASRCEHVRVRAEELLDGGERQRVTRLVYERLVQLIRTLDDAATALAPPSGWAVSEPWVPPEESSEERALREHKEAQERERAQKRKEEDRRRIEDAKANAFAVIEADIAQTEDICRRAVRRRALMAYFYGMLAGVAVFTALGVAIGIALGRVDIAGFDLSEFITTFVAGAVGAIVSVMSRMSSGKLEIEYETRRSFLALLGGFRPLIGAIFGVALYFGMASGILPIEPPRDQNEVFFFFTFLAFLAGFSERFAQDMFVTSQRAIAPESIEQRTL
jgi:hypothetical protein